MCISSTLNMLTYLSLRSRYYILMLNCRDEESLDKAMALNGAPLMGRKIRVGYAQPKKN